MFLFIGESIGMQELILIGVIALIVFGPRKLPQMARTVGKMMAEFRKATSDFKETWEKEVNFEEFRDEREIKTIAVTENTIAANQEKNQLSMSAPEIKEIKAFDFDKNISEAQIENTKEKVEKVSTGKQDWL